MVYTRIGTLGDERWRRSSKGETIRYNDDGSGERSCSVLGQDESQGPCDLDAIEFQPYEFDGFVSWLATRTLTWNSYVILDDDDSELHCYGS